MPASQSFKLLSDALRAIGTDAFEPAYVHWLASCVEINSVTTIAYFDDYRPEALLLDADSEETHSLIDDVYLPGAYKLDPMFELHAGDFSPGAYRLADICPDHFHRTEYFTSYYRHTGTIDEVGIVARPEQRVTIVVSLSRHRAARRRFSLNAMRRIHEICPTAEALAELHWKGVGCGRADRDKSTPHLQIIDTLKEKHGVKLSRRQAEVALLVLKGHSSASIGLSLGISTHTVRVFRKQIYAKCHISSQAELFRLLLPLL